MRAAFNPANPTNRPPHPRRVAGVVSTASPADGIASARRVTSAGYSRRLGRGAILRTEDIIPNPDRTRPSRSR